MSNLTSTVSGAFNALYNLLVAAGATQSPNIPVFHSAVTTGALTQNGYVLLERVEDHAYELAALGSYAHYESYNLCGCAVFYQGGPDVTTMAEDVLNQTWAIYQAVVMSTLVANRGAFGTYVLGSQAPASLEWVLPISANYTAGPGEMAGRQGLFIGEVEFCITLKARITV